MATGYTYPVKEGKITTLRDFALDCSRAFGANVMMRDEPRDAPIREYQPSTFYRDALEKAKADLFDAERMTLAAAERAAATAHAAEVERVAKYRAEQATELARYHAMLAEVEAWTPPTSDHEGLKKFMREQLAESIKFDSYTHADPVKLDGATYRQQALDDARRCVKRYAEEWEKEQQRTRERNEWNRALVASLAPVRP